MLTQRIKTAIVICIAGLLTFSGQAWADAITLKTSIRLSSAAEVITLRDIADLEGPAALAHADLPIAKMNDPHAVLEIAVSQVRAKLNDASVNWARVNLSGHRVIVRPYRSGTAQPPLAMTSIDLQQDQTISERSDRHDEVLAADVINQPTVRSSITELLVSNIGVLPDDLRVKFRVEDADFLDLQTSDLQFELHPHTSFMSDRIDLTVRRWNGSRVEESRTISILPQLRVYAAVLKADIRKDQVIMADDVIDVEQWVQPSQAARYTTSAAAIGRVAGRSLRADHVLRERDIRREVLIQRGDIVIVRCLVGGAVISLQAEARGNGSEGDTIEFRKQGERESFIATVTARGEAVVDLNRTSIR